MQLINLDAEFGIYGYIINVIGNNIALKMKFDTGANKTVISSQLIFGDMTQEQIDIIRKYCNEKVTPEIFTSASGHNIIGYPAILENVIIGDACIEHFFYYLILEDLENDRQIALLGNNFINCCEFSHQINGNIHLLHFDEEKYSISVNVVNTADLLDIFDPL